MAEKMRAMDFSYLESFAAQDMGVVDEVLALFAQQAEIWVAGLDPANGRWREVVHTIKGAARGIGAGALGDACHRAEIGSPEDLLAVRAELQAALGEIAAYRARWLSQASNS